MTAAIGLTAIALCFFFLIFVLLQDKIPFKIICKFGLHVLPDVKKVDCKKDFFICKRCGEKHSF